MIVVSDTSPLNYLVLIGAIDVLPSLFEKIHVPTQVINELQHSDTPEAVKRWALAPPEWLLVSSPSTSIVPSIPLDLGEAQAIALARELRAEVILIDERKGRRVASEFGLRAVGTLTVLELAAEQNLLDLESALALLQSTTFHVTDALVKNILDRAAARKRSQ